METTEGALKLIWACLPTAEVLEIDVRRNFLLIDALREGRKRKFSPSKQLKARIKLIKFRINCTLSLGLICW